MKTIEEKTKEGRKLAGKVIQAISKKETESNINRAYVNFLNFHHENEKYSKPETYSMVRRNYVDYMLRKGE